MKSTGIIAFVFLFIFFRIDEGEILYVSGLISAKTGVAPQYNIQFAEAANVSGVVIISSPVLMPAARHAQCSAAVPLDTRQL